MKKKPKLISNESDRVQNKTEENGKTEKEIDGAWKTLFYIDVEELAEENKQILDFLERVTASCFVVGGNCNKLGRWRGSDETPYHISLSRVNNLAKHEIEPILLKITEKLKHVCTPSFYVELQSSCLCELKGSEEDVVFGCLKIENQGTRELNNIVNELDSVLLAHNKNPYFDERIFHVSLCNWPSSSSSSLLINKQEAHVLEESIAIKISHITMKSGHLIYKIPFV